MKEVYTVSTLGICSSKISREGGNIELVKIYEARSSQEAMMIMDALSEKGISSEKKDMGGADIMDIYTGGSLCAQEIFVSADDKGRAATVLESLSLSAL